MSLITRLGGFGLCLVGAYAMGYAQGIQSVANTIISVVNPLTAIVPNLTQAVDPIISNYLQGGATPPLNSYMLLGAILAIVGFILVARGDGKPKSAEQGKAS